MFRFKKSRKVDDHMLPTLMFPTENMADVQWVEFDHSMDNLPLNSFIGGVLETGEEAFVARDKINTQTAVGFSTSTGLKASIPYDCIENIRNSYEVMTTEHPNFFNWKTCQHGNVPDSAVVGGFEPDVENLYIGRTCTLLSEGRSYYAGPLSLNRHCHTGVRVGKISPSHRCLYIPFNGNEYWFSTYEVLCHNVKPGSLAAICRWNILLVLPTKNRQKHINKLPLPQFLKAFLAKTD